MGLISVLCTLCVSLKLNSLRLLAPGPSDGFATEHHKRFLLLAGLVEHEVTGLETRVRVVLFRESKYFKYQLCLVKDS